MTKQQRNRLIVIVALVLLLLILIFTVVRSLRKIDTTGNAKLIKQHELAIKAQRDSIAIQAAIISDLKKEKSQLLQRDSMYNAHYSQNQKLYKSIDEKLKDIPDFIKRISTNDDSIRIEFAKFR